MSYEAYLTVTLQKSIKFLKKKFRSVKDDLYGVIQAFGEIIFYVVLFRNHHTKQSTRDPACVGANRWSPEMHSRPAVQYFPGKAWHKS
jgi:hypothetical protein